MLVLVCTAAAGCGPKIETLYGQGDQSLEPRSVNGTAVLQRMFRRAGHRVSSRDKLTPRLAGRADCIVWFPDDFQPPDQKHRDWLENWLCARSGRTLIYVGRDFDAAPMYWRKVKPGASTEQQVLIGTRLTEAESDFRSARTRIPTSQDCDWFTVNGKYQPRKVQTLEGSDSDWLEGVDPAKLEIELCGRIVPCSEAKVLLQSQGDVLVSSRRIRRSRLIVVANGSFLLNLPLVGHEHRKLAERLIDEAGAAEKNVVFLESHPGGPAIYDKDPAINMPTGMEIFNIWPTNWILLHLAAVGIIFCLCRAPVFGRPRQLQPRQNSDFGKHVEALGELFERSGNRSYAMARVLHYQQTARGKED